MLIIITHFSVMFSLMSLSSTTLDYNMINCLISLQNQNILFTIFLCFSTNFPLLCYELCFLSMNLSLKKVFQYFLGNLLFVALNVKRSSCTVPQEGQTGHREPQAPIPQPSSQDLTVGRKWITGLPGYSLATTQTAFIWGSGSRGPA